MAKIKDIIKYSNETISNPNGFNSDENTVNTTINEMKLLKDEEKINNNSKTQQIQQKTIKSLLNTFSNNSATTNTNNNNYYYKDSNIFRNIKTTINTNCNNLITVVSPTTTSTTTTVPTTSTSVFNNSKYIKNSIDTSNNSLSILLNNEKNFNDYNCTSCNRSYNDKEKLKRHINNTHKKEKKFECNFCYKK